MSVIFWTFAVATLRGLERSVGSLWVSVSLNRHKMNQAQAETPKASQLGHTKVMHLVNVEQRFFVLFAEMVSRVHTLPYFAHFQLTNPLAHPIDCSNLASRRICVLKVQAKYGRVETISV